MGPILAADTITVLGIFGVDLTNVAVLTGYFLLGAGAAAIFFVPSGRVWGKRHLFLIGMLIVIASGAWGGSTNGDYKSMVGARVLQGIGCAPFESMINAAVGDLYFVHQRGVRMAFTNLAVFGGAFFTPILVGKIADSMGVDWTFYWVSILMAITFPLVFVICPETAYRRDAVLNTDIVGDLAPTDPSSTGPTAETSPTRGEEEKDVPRKGGFVLFPTSGALQPIGDASTPRKSFVESLSLFDGRKTNERYWVLLLRPFPLIANPAFIWGCLIQGTMIGWTVFIGVMVGALFIGPPYFWGELKAGYAYVGAFVGAIGGFIVSGLLADSSVKWMTKWNKGIYEPEFRLLLVFPMFIIGGIGLFGFGLTIGNVITGQFVYEVPLVFFGFEVAGMVIGAVASSLYIVDAYRDLTIEGLTLMIIFKNFFSFAMTFYAYDWLINNGIEKTLVTIAGIQVAVCALTIPMCKSFFYCYHEKCVGLLTLNFLDIWGKRVRAFYYRNDLLALTKLR